MQVREGEFADCPQGFGGQVRKCCDGAKNCFTTLEDSFASIKLAAIGNQSMHKACKSFSESLQVATDCVTENTDTCHWSVNTDYVINPFHETLDSLEKLKDDHCSDLPSVENTTDATSHKTTTTTTHDLKVTTKTSQDSGTTNFSNVTSDIVETPMTTLGGETLTTTLKQDNQLTTQGRRTDAPQTTKQQLKSTTSTSTVSTTTTTTALTTSNISANPVSSSPKITFEPTLSSTNTTVSLTTSSSTPLSTSSSSNATMAIDRQGPSGSNSENTIIIISVITASLLLIIAVILCIVIKRRNRESEKSSSGGSFDPDRNQKSTLLRRLFRKSSSKNTPHNDNEIYAEIDDAFMEAVYKCGDGKQKSKKEPLRERLSSNTQVNACYEATFDDNVIKSKDSLKRNSLGDQPMSMMSLSPMELIRKQDEAITSFQMDQSDDHHNKSKSANQKQFVISKPSFTDIRSNEPDYVYIDARNEPIYAEPSNLPSIYDSAQYGRNPARNIRQTQENVYSSFSDFRNIENSNAPGIYDRVRFREYKRSGSDVDVNFYENHDTMMEY
ncbi:hypothetical protein ACF0H5_014782 [Mactra antiquata]